MEVYDDTAKKQVLLYVDSMQTSDYTAENTPHGRGQIIDVEFHRNDEIEQYVFSSQIKDGKALGKNLHESGPSKWTIVDKDAYNYLLNLISVE